MSTEKMTNYIAQSLTSIKPIGAKLTPEEVRKELSEFVARLGLTAGSVLGHASVDDYVCMEQPDGRYLFKRSMIKNLSMGDVIGEVNKHTMSASIDCTWHDEITLHRYTFEGLAAVEIKPINIYVWKGDKEEEQCAEALESLEVL